MTKAEGIEVLLIVIFSFGSGLVWSYLPSPIHLWHVMLGIFLLILLQSLIRDVAILIYARRSLIGKSRKLQCFCLETTFGVIGILACWIVMWLHLSTLIFISQKNVFCVVLATMVFGFVIKDFVITLKPLGIRREKNHLAILVHFR
jgi:hypothetical protein